MSQCAKQTSSIVARKNKGWVNLSRDVLEPILQEQDSTLHEIRSKKSSCHELLSKLRQIREKAKDAMLVAKMKWHSKLAHDVHDVNFNPSLAWRKIRELAGGLSGHHEDPPMMRMRLPNGKLAQNDEENMLVFSPHFKKVLNNVRETNPSVR